jgi:hypothetical protein
LWVGDSDEPFLRPLRRAERSASGVEGLTEVVGKGFGLQDSACEMRIERELDHFEESS